MTFSVGMRAPSSAEMLVDFAEDLAQQLPEYLRYEDPDLQPAKDPYEIDNAAFDRVQNAMTVFQQASEADRKRWFGQFITRYRASGDIQAGPHHPAWREALHAVASGHAFFRHPFARLAWSADGQDALLHVSGESHAMSRSDAVLLCHQSRITGRDFHALGSQAQNALAALYEQGFYQTDIEA